LRRKTSCRILVKYNFFFLQIFVWSPYRITNPHDFPFKDLKILPHSLRALHVFPSNCVSPFSSRVMKTLAISIQTSDTLLSLSLALVWSSKKSRRDSISPRKQQFVVTHAVCQTEISALLGSLFTNKAFYQNVVPTETLLVPISL
jgi:hypothetical protein